jgi:hypothetical protein
MRLSAVLISAVVLCLCATLADAAPRCYGAASRDTVKPCRNPDLTLRVTPTPKAALKTPNSRCIRLHVEQLVRTCWFGTRKADAKATVALVGDSHASALRAALTPLAEQLKWRGISNTRTSCGFSRAPGFGPAKLRAACARWNRQVLAWFKEHPEIQTVFFAEATDPRQNFARKVKGYRDAWALLPPAVKRIIVIRDNPRVPAATADCVTDAIRARRPAGNTCARPRASALLPDPAATAARESKSKRVKLIDLTNFYCDTAVCFPVVGGVLVLKDTTHVTSAYATTMAPYVLRAIRKLGLDPKAL